jgi:hypothetical protein
MSGSEMLMAISSSGAVTITGELSGSDAANSLLLDGTGSLAFTTTASYNAFSASYGIASASLSSRTTQVERTYATTGSNTFTGAQYISDTSNAIGFTSTASLYSDGGLRVQGNSFVSGTAYFNNVVVYGTSSIQYITSSQVNIGANIITVNTDTPAVRFGGLSVFDSGSTQLTGSILWDSEKNHWVYSNPSGSTYSGGMFISGPRSSALGSEQGTTACMLLVGQGSDHLTSSMIYHDSTNTCFYTNATLACSNNFGSNLSLRQTFTGSVVITGSLIVNTTAPELQVNNNGVILGNLLTDSHSITGSLRITGSSNHFIMGCNFGIGNVSPTVRLQVSGTIATGDNVNGWGRFSYDTTTNTTRIQSSKDGIESVGISFWTQASGGGFAERMVISGSNVGIGTADPAGVLAAQQSNTNSCTTVTIDNSACVPASAGTQGTILRFRSRIDDANIRTTGAIASYAMKNTGAGANNHGDLRFYTGQEGDTNERMRISSAGFVGVNTTVGTAALGIGGNDAQTTANLTDAGTRKGILEIIPVGGAFGYGGALVLGSDTWGTGVGRGQIALKAMLTDGSGCGVSDLAFSLRNNSACSNLTERMRITSGGNVGIGTNNPTSKLSVAGVVALGNSIDGATNLSYGGRISAKGTSVTGGAGLTIIHRGLGSVGYFILVSGVGPAGNGRFVDLVYGTGASATPTTLASSTGGTSAPTRTYSLSIEKLYLSLSGGDAWYVTTTGLGAMEE